MRTLILDLSLSTGYAVFDHEEGQEPKLVTQGVVNMSGRELTVGSAHFRSHVIRAVEELRFMSRAV